MGSVTIAILVNVVLRDGLAPECTTLEFDVVDIDASINDIYVNTVSAFIIVQVFGESREAKLRAVADTGESLSKKEAIGIYGAICNQNDSPMARSSRWPEWSCELFDLAQ